jgi:hypothetical protein
MVQAADTVELKPETLLAYEAYIGQAEAAIEQMLRSDQQFLWSDACPERIAHLRNGRTIAELYSGKRPIQMPDGMIHDWIGARCVPGTTMERTLALVQDYEKHKNIYQPEVINSKLIRRHGDDFQIYLRLRKKKNHYGYLRYKPRRALFPSGRHTLVLPYPEHADLRSGRCGQANGKSTAARHRLRVLVAA